MATPTRVSVYYCPLWSSYIPDPVHDVRSTVGTFTWRTTDEEASDILTLLAANATLQELAELENLTQRINWSSPTAMPLSFSRRIALELVASIAHAMAQATIDSNEPFSYRHSPQHRLLTAEREHIEQARNNRKQAPLEPWEIALLEGDNQTSTQ